MWQHLTTRLRRDERGSEATEWVGLTLVVLVLVILIWQALYGGPGRALKASVQGAVDHYAAGFEGDRWTSGPVGARLNWPPPVELVGGAAAAQVSRPPAPDGSIVLPPDPQGQITSVGDILIGAPSPDPALALIAPPPPRRAALRPANGVQASIDPATGLISLVDPVRQLTVTLNPASGTAALLDPSGGPYRQITLAEVERLGIATIVYRTPQTPAASLWHTLTAPVVGLPALVR